MGIRLADSLEPMTDGFPAAYGDKIWLDTNMGGGEPDYKDLQAMYNDKELGGDSKSSDQALAIAMSAATLAEAALGTGNGALRTAGEATTLANTLKSQLTFKRTVTGFKSRAWVPITWNCPGGAGRFLRGNTKVWSDGENIYSGYSETSQYILNRATSTWESMVWNGFDSIMTEYVWTNGTDIFYSNSSDQYILDKATSTWKPMVWNGYTQVRGSHIWTDGENYYFNRSNNSYALDKTTLTWESKVWADVPARVDGNLIWTDGTSIYYSRSTDQFVVDINSSSFIAKTWNGLTSFDGNHIWTDGDNIYYSYGSSQYILDKSTSTWEPITWKGLVSFNGEYVWTDGYDYFIHDSYSADYMLATKYTPIHSTIIQ